MAADPFSQLGPFDCRADDFEYYSVRFENIYEASNELDDEKAKAKKFIGTIGAGAYQILKELCKKTKPRNKTFEELKEMLLMHFSRRDFYQRNQKPDESMVDYRKEIERLAKNCFFGPFINQIIADRVAGGAYLPVSQDNSQSTMVESSVRNQPNHCESTNSGRSSRLMSRDRNNNTGNRRMRNEPNHTNSGRRYRSIRRGRYNNTGNRMRNSIRSWNDNSP